MFLKRIFLCSLMYMITGCIHKISDFKPQYTKTDELKIAAKNFQGSIGIIVPCIPRDIEKLSRLFESLKQQTKQPDEVVVSLSDTTESDGKKIEEKLRSQFPSLNVNIIPYPERANAAKNRNMAAAVSQSEYLSFIDADDSMHPEKLELIAGTFVKTGAQMIIHGFTKKFYKNIPLEKKALIIEGEQLYKIAEVQSRDYIILRSVFPIYSKYLIHAGHPTLLKSLYIKIKQREDKLYARCEDSKFIRDVMNYLGKKDQTITYLDLPLTEYVSALMQKYN